LSSWLIFIRNSKLKNFQMKMYSSDIDAIANNKETTLEYQAVLKAINRINRN
jgi:hypothetical protein